MRTTHTYATMHVSKETFDEINKRLTDAEYTHCLHDEGTVLEGVMLVHDEDQAKFEETCGYVLEAVEACKSNHYWYNATDRLTDQELAEDLIEKSGHFGEEWHTVDYVTKAVKEMRSKF